MFTRNSPDDGALRGDFAQVIVDNRLCISLSAVSIFMQTPGLRSPSVPVAVLSLLLSICVFRFVQIAGLIRFDNLDGVFNVGLIPWTDAANWVVGAADLVAGDQLMGIASARPLYPAFLSLLLGNSASYVIPVYLQAATCAAAIGVGMNILLQDRDKVVAMVMVAFWLIWWPDVNTLFMTENLGMIVLIPAMACLVYGCSSSRVRYVYAGLFLLGLSQAVRPWSLFILATVPLVLFFRPFGVQRRWRQFTLAVAVTVAGFGCHFAAAGLFNEPGNRYDNYLYTVYGQVLGGKGWSVVYEDPEIQKLLASSAPAQAVNSVLLRKIPQQFLDHPELFMQAAGKAYKNYFQTIPEAFHRSRSPHVGFCIAIALVIGYFWWRYHPSWRWLGSLSIRQRVMLAVVLIAMVIAFKWFWTVMAVVGVGRAVRYATNRLHLLVLMLLFGMMLSLPLVGVDGGVRVKLVSDVWLYLCAGLGASTLSSLIVASPDRTAYSSGPDQSMDDLTVRQVVLVVALPVVFLLVLPWLNLQFAAKSAQSVVSQTISPEELSSRLKLTEPILTPEALTSRWHEWPEKTFEEFNGHLAFFRVRFYRRDSVFLPAGVGLISPSHRLFAYHWPLSPQSFDRTVLVLENRYAMFANKQPGELGIPDGKWVWLVGTMETVRRPSAHATGFVLMISHVAYRDVDGRLVLRAVND